jgi:uncharacterized protein YndB with AHSA1/START domain
VTDVVRIALTIRAPVPRVWRALTVIDEVTQWAGVAPYRVPDGYPQRGDDALWHDRGEILRDVILDVVPERRLLSRLEHGPALVVEEYRLTPAGRTATRLTATWRGHARLATGNDATMQRLQTWCEAVP